MEKTKVSRSEKAPYEKACFIKNRKTLQWLDSNILLAGIFLCAALLIFVQSYWFGAYISPDSSHYLRAAQSLCDGYGLHIYAAAGDSAAYFSIWPIGYPFLIALVSLLTGAEIYLASKILSILILAVICLIFYFRFRETAWVYALIITNFGFLLIFWYTWSEQPFILGLIWISFAVIDILESKHIKIKHYISLCLAALFLFFSRYIGAFAVGVIGILTVYCFYIGISKQKKEYTRKALLLMLVMFIVVAVIVTYLTINKLKSGYMTGRERVPADDHPLVLCLQLGWATLGEIQNIFRSFFTIRTVALIPLGVAGLIGFFYFRLHKRVGRSIRKNISTQAVSFLAIGLLYWCSIVIMRFSADFNVFDSRLLFPASALILLGILSIILRYKNAWVQKVNATALKYILFVALSVSFFSYPFPGVYGFVRTFYKQGGNINEDNQSASTTYDAVRAFYAYYKQRTGIESYTKMRADIEKDLSSVPRGSLVFADDHSREFYANFICPDLILLDLGLLGEELGQTMIDRAKRRIYIYSDWDHLPPGYDRFLLQYKKSNAKLTQIK